MVMEQGGWQEPGRPPPAMLTGGAESMYGNRDDSNTVKGSNELLGLQLWTEIPASALGAQTLSEIYIQ